MRLRRFSFLMLYNFPPRMTASIPFRGGILFLSRTLSSPAVVELFGKVRFNRWFGEAGI
ncbi:MAG: hypothetical protein U1D30_14595 [Planctomycetota bacterium]